MGSAIAASARAPTETLPKIGVTLTANVLVGKDVRVLGVSVTLPALLWNSQSVQHSIFIWVEPIDHVFTLGLRVPDASGRYFHLNELGHEIITTWVIRRMIDTRAEVLGLGGPSGAAEDRSECG